MSGAEFRCIGAMHKARAIVEPLEPGQVQITLRVDHRGGEHRALTLILEPEHAAELALILQTASLDALRAKKARAAMLREVDRIAAMAGKARAA